MKLNNFKHKAVVLTAGVATLFATSCKDFLEEDLYAENSTSGLGKYEQFQSLTAPLYGGKLWAPYEQKFSWCVNEGLSGVLYNVYDQEGALFKLSIGDDNTILKEGYTGLYSGVIATANQIIDKVTRILDGLDPLPEVSTPISTEQLEEVRGEALLFRAFAHFLATEYFGNVPLILDTQKDIAEDAKIPLASRATLYKSIEKDLLQAIAALPDKPTDARRASKMSAKAVLAKLYLTMASCQSSVPGAPYLEADVAGKYQKVKELCTEIIGSGKYSLAGHDVMFAYDEQTKPSSETVFAIYCVNGEYGEGSSYQSQMGRNEAWSPGSGWGEGKGISYNLYKSFDNSDPRKKELCLYVDAGEYECRSDDKYPIAIYGKDFHGKTADGCFGVDFFSSGAMVFNNIKKFVWGVSNLDFHPGVGMSIQRRIDLIRLSDVYMMRAEAAMAMENLDVCAPTSAGLDDINAVLKAHGATELTAAIPFIEDLSSKKLSVESFTIVLDDSTTANVDVPLTETMYHNVSRYDFMQERRKEFAMEGQAWLDLKRLYYRNPLMAETFLVQMDRGVKMVAIPKASPDLLEVEAGYARKDVINALNNILADMYPEKWEKTDSPNEDPILLDNFKANNYWFLPIPASAKSGIIDEVKDFVAEVERGTYPY
ncbi:MAG: RagB/SusD family nutrient uptake outer membrane protein [Paludibacteraceae bacterium]|jgi:hypothetical protein|nr:RagB/SusD family nutrient uptake outer membrane protein [Paludibacteraceae bacterium]